MDLYADLPLAKGASSAALDANGNVKTSASSVWKTTTAPAFVPQVMRNAQQQGRGRGAIPPAVDTKSAVNMVPAALRTKSPHGAPAAATSTSAKKPSGISLAFKPASITRKPAAPQFVSTSIRPASSSGNSGAAPADDAACTTKGRFSQFEDAVEPQSRAGIGMRGGLGFATVTEVVRIQPAQGDENQHIAANENAGPATQSFQANYRDEYNPARPNSYEAYCEERLNKKKIEQVKRELERRQREQEREGKLERERLVRDIAEGKAPAIDLPAAGRGRGMTMPAWMRKKMEETAAAKQVETDPAQRNVGRSAADQFEDAAPRVGLGFSQAASDLAAPHTMGLGFSSRADSYTTGGRSSSAERRSERSGYHHRSRDSAATERDEFGREIKRRDDSERQQNAQEYKRGRDGGTQEPRATSRHDSSKRHRDQDAGASASATQRGCVILLQNMVGPGEVDDELQDEVKEECAEKYGPVEKCLIHEVQTRVPLEQAVRIFVQFQRPSDAEKARVGLNARFFGGRKVQATYYDDDRFQRLDLTA